jgi:type I restriction enzyme S subunit
MRTLTPHFHALKRWDFKSAIAAHFRSEHPDFVPLGNYVEEATELVAPAREPAKRWPVYGVSTREGVFFSHDQAGSEFKGNYKRIREGWFFHNPTRANIGSIGRVPTVSADAITSPEYQVWRPKLGVNPDYIEVLVKSRLFVSLVEIHRVGAVKERLFTANLLEIPVPVLTEADQLVLITGIVRARAALAEAQRHLQVEYKKSETLLTTLVSSEFGSFASSDSDEFEEA